MSDHTPSGVEDTMSRSLRKEWKNVAERRTGPRKSYNGWTRRVRWYCEGEYGGPITAPTNIRLQFEDEDGIQNVYYGDDKDKADTDWEAFRAGTLTVAVLWARDKKS